MQKNMTKMFGNTSEIICKPFRNPYKLTKNIDFKAKIT